MFQWGYLGQSFQQWKYWSVKNSEVITNVAENKLRLTQLPEKVMVRHFRVV